MLVGTCGRGSTGSLLQRGAQRACMAATLSQSTCRAACIRSEATGTERVSGFLPFLARHTLC